MRIRCSTCGYCGCNWPMCRSFRANHGKAKATPATAGGDYHVYLALDNPRHEAGKQIDPASAPAPSSTKFCPSVQPSLRKRSQNALAPCVVREYAPGRTNPMCETVFAGAAAREKTGTSKATPGVARLAARTEKNERRITESPVGAQHRFGNGTPAVSRLFVAMTPVHRVKACVPLLDCSYVPLGPAGRDAGPDVSIQTAALHRALDRLA